MSLSLPMFFDTLRNFMILTYVVGNNLKVKKIAIVTTLQIMHKIEFWVKRSQNINISLFTQCTCVVFDLGTPITYAERAKSRLCIRNVYDLT